MLKSFFSLLLAVSSIILSGCGDTSSSKKGVDLEPSVTQPPIIELPYIAPPYTNGIYYNVLKDVDNGDDTNYSVYEFDEHNNLIAIKSYADNLPDDTTRYEYDDSGKIIKYTWDSDGDGDADAFDSFVTYEYTNSAISAAHFNAYLKGVGWVESPLTFKYEYFGSGGIQISSYRYDQLASYIIRVYDDNGNLIHRYEDGDLDGEYESQTNFSYEYDVNGNTIKMTDSSNGKVYVFEYERNVGAAYGYYPVFGLDPLDLLFPVVNRDYHLTKISFADSGGTITGSQNVIWETEASDTNETVPGGTDTNETVPGGTDTNETVPVDPCDAADANFTFFVASYNYTSEIWVSDISPAVDPSSVPVCALTLYWEFDNGYTYSGGGVDANANETPGIAPSVDECNVSFTVTGTWENNATYTTSGIWSYSPEYCTQNDANTSTLYRDDINEVVIDTTNNLMWQDDKDTKTVIKIWAYIKDAVSDADYYDTSGDTAATYCSELTLGGYSDWRLPTKNELLLMISYSSVETLFAYYSPNNDYWTSETKEDTISNAYTVIFPSGVIGDLNKGKKANFRCVRDLGN